METTSTKILRTLSSELSFPTFISIGDPMYFEDGIDTYTYEKSFRGKSHWIGEIQLIETEETYLYEGKERSFNDIFIKVFYAPDQKNLNLYKEDKIYASQKVKTTKIGVDTASYILQINKNGNTIRTGGDGLFGGVSEIYRGSRLEGILLELGLGDVLTFEECQSQIEYIFNCKLK